MKEGLWERLEILRAIVDTARAEDLERIPETIRARYELYAETYFLLDPVKRVEHRLLSELRSGHPVTGYISADFGYGKTATSIRVWKRLLDDGFLAVPPFLFRSLGDLIRATWGWLRHQIQQRRPSLLERVEEIYRLHISQAQGDLAKEIAIRQAIPEPKARAIVQEYIARRRDVATSRSVLSFLEAATALAQETGFKGLIVFADEIQEFIRVEESGAKDAIQTLSELVKGIRAMSLPFGFIITMPVTPTEMAIEEQAGDIMHRMREQGTALRLEEVYGRTFPRRLWEHLCASFGGTDVQAAVDERTLEALGQICERKDLSDGPRTVISAFKRIAQHYRETHRPYTPIDLIDDYLQGLIVFEGKEAKLTRTLRPLLDTPHVRGNLRREQAVKLLAAFPRGVDAKLAGDLYPIIEDLAEKGDWLGEYITQLPEGFALVGLREDTRRRPILDEVVRDFRRRWHHVYSEEQKLALALVTVAQEVLPLLFPPRSSGQYANFGGHRRELERFERDARGVWYEIIEGSFERLYTRFPGRKVCLALGTGGDALTNFRPPEDVDLDIRFFLETPGDPEAPVRIITASQDRRIDIYLNLNRTFGRHFPQDLTFLRDIMLPEHTSAQVLLVLSMRIWGWLREHPDTSEADRQMMEAQRRVLHRYAVQLLFPDASDPTKVELQGIRVSGAGQQLMEALFEVKCAELYPDYRPLAITKEWSNYLRRYRDALSRRPLSERRGREPFTASKEEIARAFGWPPATFENQSRLLQEMGLLKVHWGRGRGTESEARVEFLEHPLEQLLLQALQREGRERSLTVGLQVRRVKSLEISRLQDIAKRCGYLEEETEEALELLILRQRIQRAADGTVHEFPGALDAGDLSRQAQELETRLAHLLSYFGGEVADYQKGLESVRHFLANPEDEVMLDTAQRKLYELEVRLDEFIKNKISHLVEQISQALQELDKRKADLSPRELDSQVIGATDFVRWVDDARRVLQREFGVLRGNADQLREALTQARKRLLGEAKEKAKLQTLIQVLEIYQDFHRQRDHLEKRLQTLRPYLMGLQRWREIVARITNLRDRLDPESPLRKRLDEETSAVILDNFVNRKTEALLDWERFRAEVDQIEAELQAEEDRQRKAFHECKEAYETALGRLLSQRVVQAIFDPKDPGQSYEVLYSGVLRKAQDWLKEQQEDAGRVLSEWEYLIQEREIPATEEQKAAEKICHELRTLSAEINLELIRNLEAFRAYVDRLQGIWERLQNLKETLNRQRAQKVPLEDTEKDFLGLLTQQPRSIESLRRDRGLNLDELFGLLKSLYRKGYLQLLVSRRE